MTARSGDRHSRPAAADNTKQRWLRRSVAVSDQPHPDHRPGLIESNIDRLHDARDTVVAVARRLDHHLVDNSIGWQVLQRCHQFMHPHHGLPNN